MKIHFLLHILLFLLLFTPLHGQDTYHIQLDLKNASEDQINVTINLPEMDTNQYIFQLPRVMPGSYSYKNFGRFIDRFKAYDSNGKKLRTKYNKELNQYIFKKEIAPHQIQYQVEDTWDHSDEDLFIFQPGGLFFRPGEVFMLNAVGFSGYFRGYKDIPYKLSILRPDSLYGATALKVIERGKDRDVFKAGHFSQLVDRPIMYAQPDTISFKHKNTRFLIHVYSHNKKHTANQISKLIKPVITQAMSNFFPSFPMKEYHFIFYLSGYQEKELIENGSYGALEHRTSSVYFLPEILNKRFFKRMLHHITAHEFLHTIMPLNLRSHEIHHFDYGHPDMSKHLWFYEGVVEYYSNLLLFREGLISEKELQKNVSKMIAQTEKYPRTSFTKMSKHILTEEYNNMYLNVYYKGALLALCLDIEIRTQTNNQESLEKIVFKLFEKYKDSSFHDDSLIKEIVELTSPGVASFFNRYISGNDSIPYGTFLNQLGWDYFPTYEDSLPSFGNIDMEYNHKEQQLYVSSANEDNFFGFRDDDIIYMINDTLVTEENYPDMAALLEYPADTSIITVDFESGTRAIRQIKQPSIVPKTRPYHITTQQEISSLQDTLRHAIFYNTTNSLKNAKP